ncbi:hypothetical protein EON62_02885 [archaeon]|nr:MAG: hypothetical protein EON62_02885 [archaeon]
MRRGDASSARPNRRYSDDHNTSREADSNHGDGSARRVGVDHRASPPPRSRHEYDDRDRREGGRYREDEGDRDRRGSYRRPASPETRDQRPRTDRR